MFWQCGTHPALTLVSNVSEIREGLEKYQESHTIPPSIWSSLRKKPSLIRVMSPKPLKGKRFSEIKVFRTLNGR